MDKVRRAFLRACINHSCLTYDLIDEILTPLCEMHKVTKPNGTEEIKSFVAEIEQTIKEFHQALTFIKHPVSGQDYLVYYLTDPTPDIHLHPNLTAEECQYFSILLDKVANNEECKCLWNMAYSGIDFKNSAKPPKKMRMQELLNEWIDSGYFLEDGDYIYLGPRSILELEFYLRTNYSETIKECMLCRHLVLWDIKCSECDIKLHRNCIRKYLRTRSNCPSCNKQWNTRLSV
ncbi:non-structural maintenance of chromosomes element 1 homolog [Scaptodrosophila lebanonensis]|uniref:Non-structural maintenance of chromosomes element 1 homolog n=1 Tax=Drosophila lebanonensis TaxID=7225 RepID=A0A6J2TLQ7_DROLE|nr:non-structural maintenance of chromosomes element 1 homolog [Scaptodrosophila lebanonensis]